MSLRLRLHISRVESRNVLLIFSQFLPLLKRPLAGATFHAFLGLLFLGST